MIKQILKSIWIWISSPFKSLTSFLGPKKKVVDEIEFTLFCYVCKKPYPEPIQHLKGRILVHGPCEKKSLLTNDESKYSKASIKFIDGLPLDLLFEEYQLIVDNKSKFLSLLRELVLSRTQHLVRNNTLKLKVKNDTE